MGVYGFSLLAAQVSVLVSLSKLKETVQTEPLPICSNIVGVLIALSSLNAARHHECLSLMDCYCEQFYSCKQL